LHVFGALSVRAIYTDGLRSVVLVELQHVFQLEVVAELIFKRCTRQTTRSPGAARGWKLVHVVHCTMERFDRTLVAVKVLIASSSTSCSRKVTTADTTFVTGVRQRASRHLES